MKQAIYNTSGEKLNILSPKAPSLHLVWSKGFDELYCHNASLSVPYVSPSLFLPDLAKVSVKVRYNVVEKGCIKSSSDKIISRFLPIKFEDQHIIIPLHSAEILDGLCENGWTTLKGGKRGAPKSFPISISVQLDDNEIEIRFNTEANMFPFTICEEILQEIKESEKILTIIYK